VAGYFCSAKLVQGIAEVLQPLPPANLVGIAHGLGYASRQLTQAWSRQAGPIAGLLPCRQNSWQPKGAYPDGLELVPGACLTPLFTCARCLKWKGWAGPVGRRRWTTQVIPNSLATP